MAEISCFALYADGAGTGEGTALCWQRSSDSRNPGFVDSRTRGSIWMEPLRPGGPNWPPSPPFPSHIVQT